VLPINQTLTATVKPIATIIDIIPILNIPPFGTCISVANPMVIAATAAALGILTPQPCILDQVMPWSPASTKVKIRSNPAVIESSKTMCAWAGQISIIDPGQQKVDFT